MQMYFPLCWTTVESRREGGSSFLQTSKKVGIAEEGDGEIAKDRKA